MRKKVNGIRITILRFVILLSIMGASLFLSGKGGHTMEKKVNEADAPAKPAIDMNVPKRIETATFAMG
jgi:hypothetical protein